MLLRRALALLFGLWLGCFAGAGVHAASSVVIVSSERSAAYTEAAQTLLDELDRNGVARRDVLLMASADWPTAAPPPARLYVTLGAAAAAALSKSILPAPTLCTLLPRSSFDGVLGSSGRKASAQFSALILDQPVGRQLELIRLALPTVRRVGVLRGSDASTETTLLRAVAQARGFHLTEVTVGAGDSLFPAIKEVLEASDVLLAQPDTKVYNSNTVQNILLASFRAKVPMVAFSPSYVRAGALLAVHVSPAQIGAQAAALAGAVLQGKSLPEAPVYSREFEITVNEHVARSFGLTLDQETLRQSLRRREGLP